MQTILLHHQDVVIQNRRKLYSEPPSYRSVSDRVKKNKALLNGQCWFLFVLIFHLRTVTEVAEWVFKGLLNAQMNKSWPWMFPFRFPFSGVVEERTWELLSDPPLLSKPEISIAIATEWLHVFLATAFSHCYKKNRTGLLKTWIQVSPTSLVHTHTQVCRGTGWRVTRADPHLKAATPSQACQGQLVGFACTHTAQNKESF